MCIRDSGADWLNDINGFADPEIYEVLADATCRLVVMHAIQAKGIATRAAPPDGDIWEHILAFFDARLERLTRANIDPARLVLDPGTGFFSGQQAGNFMGCFASDRPPEKSL